MAEWSLREDVVEKDYVLGWLLAAVAADDELSRSWIFKGGTCLRKCYYETYRFSEDLDFTVIDGGPEAPDDLVPIFERVGAWLADTAGIEIEIDDRSFQQKSNRRGNPTTLGKIGFRGPRNPRQLSKVKLDLTSDERVVDAAVMRGIHHPYSDDPLPVDGVSCYSITDLLAEKLRALAERCRPRDLYDVVHVHRHAELVEKPQVVLEALVAKCEFVGIAVPDANTIRASQFVAEIEQEWGNMLAHQLPHLPPFEDFWGELDGVFAWLTSSSPIPELPTAELGANLDPTWRAPRAFGLWGGGRALDLIRFAGANRLLVEIDYQAANGRWGPRVVEPYSLRMTKDGNVLLFVINDSGYLRGYRVDRIRGARVTDQSFQPRFHVEF